MATRPTPVLLRSFARLKRGEKLPSWKHDWSENAAVADLAEAVSALAEIVVQRDPERGPAR
jgi:hypothetical protein